MIAWRAFAVAGVVASLFGVPYFYIENASDNLSEPFTNDGLDRDFKDVSNAVRIEVDRDSHICQSAQPSFLYQWHIRRHWTGNLFDRKWEVPSQVYAEIFHDVVTANGDNIEGDNATRVLPMDHPICRTPNAKNIYIRARYVMANSPNEYLNWIRIRRGNQYLTIYLRRDLGVRGEGDKNPIDIRSATSRELSADYSELLKATQQTLIPVGLAQRKKVVELRQQRKTSSAGPTENKDEALINDKKAAEILK